MGGWEHGWIDGWMDGQTEEQMDEKDVCAQYAEFSLFAPSDPLSILLSLTLSPGG